MSYHGAKFPHRLTWEWEKNRSHYCLPLSPTATRSTWNYKWNAHRGDLSKESKPVFTRVSEKTMKNCERLQVKNSDLKLKLAHPVCQFWTQNWSGRHILGVDVFVNLRKLYFNFRNKKSKIVFHKCKTFFENGDKLGVFS